MLLVVQLFNRTPGERGSRRAHAARGSHDPRVVEENRTWQAVLFEEHSLPVFSHPIQPSCLRYVVEDVVKRVAVGPVPLLVKVMAMRSIERL